ncbi:MAG TPA: PQ-loop repeat-containing protein [Candidatus Saccharimonadales bacterium]|jgi:uncharacterized protein with PQ loop repeat
MPLDALISVLTTVVSVLVKVVGLPDQIKSNYRRKSTDGLSAWFVLSAFVSYALWVVHGLLVHDWSLVIGQGLGVLTTGVIVWQLFLYRGPHKTSKPAAAGRLLLLGLPMRASQKERRDRSARSDNTKV